jgi:Icc-related predicted phosphoesterase
VNWDEKRRMRRETRSFKATECTSRTRRHTSGMDISANRLLVVGCVHADYTWFAQKVLPTAAENEVDAVLVSGDFGYWRDRKGLLGAAASSQARFGVETWFVDGNHEDHPLLAEAVASSRIDGDEERSPVALDGSLLYIPRGGRFHLGDAIGVGCGGARSIDKDYRVDGLDWFKEEAITSEDVEAVARGGHADLMVTHDAPWGWQIPGLMSIEKMEPEWQGMLEACWEHRKVLREAFVAVSPSVVLHGHYHSGYEKVVHETWGDVRIVGLDHNNKDQWGRIVSARGTQIEISDWVKAIKRTKPPKP